MKAKELYNEASPWKPLLRSCCELHLCLFQMFKSRFSASISGLPRSNRKSDGVWLLAGKTAPMNLRNKTQPTFVITIEGISQS